MSSPGKCPTLANVPRPCTNEPTLSQLAPDVVKILCQVPGIDLNFQTGGGITAAMFAVIHQNPGCVQVLSTVTGVNWNIKDNDNVSPLALAVHRGFIDILSILMTIPTIDFNIADIGNLDARKI